MRWCTGSHMGMIHYLVIAAVIVGVCKTEKENAIERADERIRSIDSSLVDLVKVELYYAALCNDAMRFVNNQLVPTYEELGDYIYVTYIPYGKGTHEKFKNENGIEEWSFTCQHGDAGCYGNKAQACAINEILTNPEITNEQIVLVDLVGCVMSSDNRSMAVPECLETIGINANYISSVNNCIASSKGDELLAAYGDKTHALEPALTFVPTIVINEVFSQDNQDKALVDFQGLICEFIPAEIKPTICEAMSTL